MRTPTRLAALLTAVCATLSAAQDFSVARQLIQRSMAADTVPGLVIAVVRGDSILWEEGFGFANRERRVPATPQTPFYLASLSKTITATELMVLRERGKLNLDLPANDYLRGAKLWGPRWDTNGATVRRLMTHTAGLTTFDVSCPVTSPRCGLPDNDELIRRYGVLVWQPGERYDYSNLGYLVLGHVAAGASGQGFGEALQNDVFRPLGMARSSLGVAPAWESETAIQYHWVNGALPRLEMPPSGASTIHASAHDLVQFAKLHLKVHPGGRTPILSDAAIDTIQANAVPSGGGARYGSGWTIDENRFGFRSLLGQGGVPGSTAWLRMIPSERIAVIVLANRGVAWPNEVIDLALAAMLPQFAERRRAQLAAPAATAAAPAPPRPVDSAFVGAWSGYIRDEKGDVPVKLAILPDGAVRGTIGSEQRERVGSGRYGTLLRIALPGDLVSTDSTGRQVILYLRQRDGVLYGNVNAFPREMPGYDMRVAYWTELKRQP